MSDNQPITDKLTEAFPRDALKYRQGGGRNGLAYYSGDTIIRRLIHATDNRFDVEVTDFQMTDTLIIARVRLTIPGLGSREHMGVQRWSDKTKSGALSGEDLTKGAITDALKKAATLFGVALDLYGEDYEAEAPAPQRAAAPAPAKPAPVKRQADATPEQSERGEQRRAEVREIISHSDWTQGQAVRFLRSIGMDRWSDVTEAMLNRLTEEIWGADDGTTKETAQAAPAPASGESDWIARINAATDGPTLTKVANAIIKTHRDPEDPIRLRLKQRFDELNDAAVAS